MKLSPKTHRFLKKIKRKYKIKVSVGDIQEFNIKSFALPEAAGYFFVVDGKKHIYVNNKQSYRNSHDLVVLHEIGHALMHSHELYQYSNQEESFANGYALAMATELGLKVSESMIMEMADYSETYFLKNKSNRYKKKTRK